LNHDFCKPIVERVARRLSFEWPGIERDDIEQEIWRGLTERWESVKAQPEAERGGLVSFFAERFGVSYCSRERQFYQHFTAEWIYQPHEVRRLMVDYFDADAWLAPVKRPEGTNQTLLGDGVTVALFDIDRAFKSLTETDQQILIRVFNAGETLGSTDRKKLQRAIDRIVVFLNRTISKRFDHSDHEGPGSREVVSNATARALTHETY
jgi:hypothetical protein